MAIADPNEHRRDAYASDRTEPELDVLIAGAGPVGLVLAIELARRGRSVHLVDALAAPTSESRAIVVNSRSLDHFEAIGALEPVMSRARVAHGMQMHAGDKTVAEISFGGVGGTHPYSVTVAQTDTESVLTGRLDELGVKVDRATSVTGFSQLDDGVDAEVTGSDGSVRTIRSRFLVGADGARSAVRRLMGQQLRGSFVGEDFLLGDVEGEHDYDPSRFHTFFSPGTTTGLLFALPGNRVRVFAQLPAGTDPERPVTIEWLQHALDERGMQLRIRTSHWLGRFELKHGQVPRYRDGRVLLAGDAAHIHSPAGGLGMNTGIQDAMNLGWKLAASLDGAAAPALLDSYQSERHPIAAGVISFSSRLSKVGTLSNPLAQHARNVLLGTALKLPGVAGRMADVVEQQNVHYRDSPIVGGASHHLRPGDYLYLSGPDDGAHARRAPATPGHRAGRDRHGSRQALAYLDHHAARLCGRCTEVARRYRTPRWRDPHHPARRLHRSDRP